MNPKLKKGLSISLVAFATLLVALVLVPFAFQGKIASIAKKQVNSMLNAEVNFDRANISLIRKFPAVSVKLESFSIKGQGEFSGDTLLASENVELVLNLKSLFSDTGYEIRKLEFDNPKVFAHVLPDGKANWDIMKEDTTQAPDTSATKFHLKLKSFEITNADILYLDEEGNMKAEIHKLNHTTNGDLTADSSLLNTSTSIETLSFWMDNVKYLSDANVEMKAAINANINKMVFAFSENSSRINAIPFSFSGWFQMLDEGYDMDLKLNASKVGFKEILSLVPAIYANSFEGMKAGGKVSLDGFVKGKMVGDYYPSFDLNLKVADGWFQYPNLPQSLRDMNIAARIQNPGKTLDETVVDIPVFMFVMAGNPFSASMHLATPMSDPDLKLAAVGKIDLGKIKDLYPLEQDTKLNGLLDMNLQLAGRMSYYDNNQYDKFKFAGNMNIRNMVAKMESLTQEVSISNASMSFNNRFVDLSDLQMKIGRNDLSAKGKLENFVAYALHDKILIGSLSMNSTYFNANDFIPKTEPSPAKKNEGDVKPAAGASKTTVFEIPKNINFSLLAKFNQLVYEKMNFTNASGTMTIADGELKFKEMGVDAFGGRLNLNGVYSTADIQKPTVNLNLSLDNVVFTEIFKQVETVQKLAPIFEKTTGKFNAKFNLNTLLDSNMSPVLSLLGADGSLSTSSIGVKNVPALTALASALKRSDLSNTTIKDLFVLFQIKDGKLYTKPFDVKLNDAKMNIGGSTRLDKTIDYAGKIQLPDRLKLGQLSTFNFKIGGTITKPKVQVDLAGTLKNVSDETKAKVEAEVSKKVDEAKTKALEEARLQKEKAMKAAQEEAARIREQARNAGDKLLAEAKTQGDNLVAKANNPIAKKAAELAAKKLLDEARKKAADLNAKAETEADKLIQKAGEKATIGK
ncbi:MAG TPA: AsmA-like C-terminal region-containing protein [Paludibacter sp.]|nr:AsmA-like C-terminal region-containing protein [Paludibacter sp.]